MITRICTIFGGGQILEWKNGQLRTMDMFKDRDGMKIDMLSNEN